VQNNLGELFTLLQFLAPSVFAGDAREFVTLFDAPFQPGEEGGAALSEEERLLLATRLHAALRPFLLRRVKEAVASDIPERSELLLRTPMAAYQRRLYDAVLSRAVCAREGGGAIAINNVLMVSRCGEVAHPAAL